MKHWQTLAMAGSLAIAALGCESQQKGEPTPPATTVPKDSLAQEDIPSGGYLMEVQSLGIAFRGQESTEWRPFEEIGYDAKGREVSRKTHFDGSGASTKTTYGPDDRITLVVHDPNDGSGRVETRHSWNPSTRTETLEEWRIQENKRVAFITKVYDAENRLLQEETVDDRTKDVTVRLRVRNVYNAKGLLVQQFEKMDDHPEILGRSWEYNAAGQPTKVIQNDAEGNPSEIEWYTYDAQGKKQKRFLQSMTAYNRNKVLEAVFAYDEKGRLVREEHYSGDCEDLGAPGSVCNLAETVTYTYDPHGRLTMEVRQGSEPGKSPIKKRFDYQGAVIVPGS